MTIIIMHFKDWYDKSSYNTVLLNNIDNYGKIITNPDLSDHENGLSNNSIKSIS